MDIEKTLKTYGLSEQEAATYVALLKLVEAPATRIAEQAKMPRTNTYSALERLKVKGFVTSTRHNGVQFFTPENPNVLLDALEEKKKLVSAILPELADLIDTAKIAPVVKTFKGKQGYIKARKDMLEVFKKKKIKQIYVLSSPMDFKIFPKFFPGWVAERIRMGVTARTLLREDARVDTHFQSNKNDMREVRYLPPAFQFDGTMNVYDTKIALFSFGKRDEITSIIIDSPTLAEMMRQFFQFTWSLAQPNP